MLYFIYEQKMPLQKGSNALKPLKFDVTYIAKTDTVSMKTTVISPQPYKQDKITIEKGNGQKIEVPTEIIYRDLGKKGYVNRIELKLNHDLFQELYTSTLPYTIDYGNNTRFGFTPKSWLKHSQDIYKIWQMIELNQ